ncbi:MAG TPA: hypothetical protein VJ719_04300 [Chthoniobacterales bacterium]|nr:hypothetical protein [Chthoniobacterales bacterium]
MNEAFNYVAVLVSIIIGLGVTRVLTGVSDAIQVGNRPRIYWVHTVWMVNLLIGLMLFWWVLYRWNTAPQWTFFIFLWVNVAPILMYLASGVLCPGELEKTGSPDWRDYYYRNRRGFFFVFGSIWPLDVVDTLLKGQQHFIAQGGMYLPTIVLWTLGNFAAGLTKNERYHKIWVVLFPVSQIAYVTVQLLSLG